MFETGAQSFKDMVDEFVDAIVRLIKGFLAIFGGSLGGGSTGGDDKKDETTTKAA